MKNHINLKIKEILKLGVQNQKEKNFKEAIKNYENIIKIDPSIVYAYNNLGLIYVEIENIDLAKKNFLLAIKINPSFIYSYINLGILFQNEGQKEKAIECFEKIIEIDPKNISGYNNLGLVNASLGKYKKALKNYLKTLSIDSSNIIAIKSIIFLLTYHVSDNDHPIINANNELRLLKQDHKLINLLTTENLSLMLKRSIEILNKISIDINKLNFTETQSYRRNALDLNCDYHHKVFYHSNIIPKFCFSCFKVQIEPEYVIDLIRLFFIFDNLNLPKNNQRKCMVEFRNQVAGLYKGMIYCSSLEEAKKILEELRPILQKNLKFKASIKRGCSEFYNSFPSYKIIESDKKNYMTYDQDWEKIEENLKIKKNFNTIKFNNSITGLSISDVLIIIQWLNYAKIVGDPSIEDVDLNFFNSKFIENKLSNQVEFRKKEFINIE
ncbi:tetratricopeptide repeat protein [Candidatus Pelagibacter sp.]|nr:tetratricopeptide repeat protein [Candidatus Pelagibacter sp.]